MLIHRSVIVDEKWMVSGMLAKFMVEINTWSLNRG